MSHLHLAEAEQATRETKAGADMHVGGIGSVLLNGSPTPAGLGPLRTCTASLHGYLLGAQKSRDESNRVNIVRAERLRKTFDKSVSV
jgi:hypothetical protein